MWLPCAEINEAYNAFEEQRQQNATLLTQLTERDAALAAAQAEKLAVELTVQQLTDKVCVGSTRNYSNPNMIVCSASGDCGKNFMMRLPVGSASQPVDRSYVDVMLQWCWHT